MMRSLASLHGMFLRGRLMLVVAAGALGACAPPPAQDQQDQDSETSAEALRGERAPLYRDVEASFTTEDDQNRWFEVRHGLNRDFDDICGDTFCEGDFTNLASMRFRCSVSTRTGLIKTCLWLFAGSDESVTASTGNIRPNAKFFSCTIPVTGTPRQLMDALLSPEGEGPLSRKLPGSAKAIYDHLGDCL